MMAGSSKMGMRKEKNKPEQFVLIDVPAVALKPADRRAQRVAEFNLLAWGTHARAITEIEKDIERHINQWQKSCNNWHAQPNWGKPSPEPPKRPDYQVRILRLAVSFLEQSKPMEVTP